jgi:peptide/nickel transport system permease protein
MARSRAIRIAVIVLILVHLPIVFAGFVAPYDYAEQHRDHPYAHPTRVRFDPHPFVYGLTPKYNEDLSRRYFIHFLASGRLFTVDPGGSVFLLGTDAYGRDIFSRLLYGGRISLAAGILAAGIALVLGLVCGTLSGFWGGWPDRILMRLAELFLALPWLYLLLAVRAFLPLHISPIEAFLLIVAIVGSIGWVRPARLIRGLVLSLKERPYVDAARTFDGSSPYLIRRHILPETSGLLLTQATILIPQYILAEVTLSFLGLGVGEPVPSWGSMLSEARQYQSVVSHWWMLAPGFATFVVLLVYLVLADLVQEKAAGRP